MSAPAAAASDVVVPIRFVLPALASLEPAREQGRPPVTFSVHALPRGGAATITATSRGGWVFCGTDDAVGCGESLRVLGGEAQYLAGFSGDETEVTFALVHDGVAHEVVVTYNTRPD
jgi:hypothetical protein